jgi:Lactate dehydrogenase and related dehydrogenases
MRRSGVTYASKEDLFRTADIVSIHLMLSDRSRGLIGAKDLALMKPTAYLINTARAAIVDQAALLTILTERRIAGAALTCLRPSRSRSTARCARSTTW